MRHNPDTALEVALEQRQRLLDHERQALSAHLRAVQEQADLLPPAVHCPCLIYDNGVVREEPNDCIHVATVAG